MRISISKGNIEAYTIIYKLENTLRKLIKELLSNDGPWLDKVSNNLIRKWNLRAQQEKAAIQDLGSDEIIDYCEFCDIRDIITCVQIVSVTFDGKCILRYGFVLSLRGGRRPPKQSLLPSEIASASLRSASQ